ncbi:RES family NAD+ phosphorylase [Caulobacter sp. CCNWLY153]|uniref:RES domain-containing protein n=1 Tax=Caulobacter radicis TaxID=2172650 RepID=A0A2T9JB10_9CAUL|nr:RES family NAD+ phosphorylase [Caulobacter radicis]PVM79410.1 RES domain-containing protein [Caulobacter radicis]PVM83531.1 RES domain-containing protein [Caulobacter radicis]
MTNDIPNDAFPSWRSYWLFERSVTREFRYVRPPEVEAFLQAVLVTSQSRKIDIPRGSLFWRAALGHDWRAYNSCIDDEVPCAHPPARMKPLPDKASDGRANARGIPCLYMATSKTTAMAEVRPWIGSKVSVGQFRTNRPLSVVDCSRRHDASPFFLDLEIGNGEPSSEERTEAVWTHIDKAFAEPMTRSDDQADYAATQILAELFKSAGFDGVVYKSNFGKDGYNIALFDPNAADLIKCGLFELKAIEPDFKASDDFYYVGDGLTSDDQLQGAHDASAGLPA